MRGRSSEDKEEEVERRGRGTQRTVVVPSTTIAKKLCARILSRKRTVSKECRPTQSAKGGSRGEDEDVWLKKEWGFVGVVTRWMDPSMDACQSTVRPFVQVVVSRR